MQRASKAGRPGTSTQTARLLRRAAAGNARAAEQIYRSHVDALYAFVYPRVGRRADVAEDVVQTVFIQAFSNAETYDPQRASLPVWLRLLSRNVIRSHWRAGDRTSRLARLWGAVERRLNQHQSLPPSVLTQPETQDLVQMALALLPDAQRQLLRARYMEGKSAKALAAAAGIEVEAIRSRIARARKAFRRAFERLEDELND